MNDDQPISIDVAEMYECRMVCLLETYPDSNEYRQFIFNKDQFAEVSKMVASQFEMFERKGNLENIRIITHDKNVILPGYLQSFYDQQQIDKFKD